MVKRQTLTWLAAGCAVLAVLAVVLAIAVTSGTASWLLVASAVTLLTAGAGLWQQARSARP